MNQCSRCGDEAGYRPDGVTPNKLCEDCYEISKVGEHGAARVAHARSSAVLPHHMTEGSKHNLAKADGNLERIVREAHNDVVQTGEPMGPTLARAVVEMGLLRAMLSKKSSTVLSAATKLSQLYGLHRKPAQPDEPEEELTEEEEADANGQAQELADSYGIDVSS